MGEIIHTLKVGIVWLVDKFLSIPFPVWVVIIALYWVVRWWRG